MTRENTNQLPADDLVELEVAFDMLGRHRFGNGWPSGMAKHVRLRQRSKDREDLDIMARWALRALNQAVQNGWLPLTYFIGDQSIRRVNYFGNPDGYALHALYPRPTEDNGGQIELDDGAIYPCLVNIRDFTTVLTKNFGEKAKRGRKRGFLKFDVALDDFYQTNPTSLPHRTVLDALREVLPDDVDWPKETIQHRRINEAIGRRKAHDRSLKK